MKQCKTNSPWIVMDTCHSGVGTSGSKFPRFVQDWRTSEAVLVPPYIRKTPSLEAAVPWLYLKGVSSGEMNAALQVLIGPQAKGLSASTVSRLKQVWADEYRHWNDTSLDTDRWVYIWADGVYSGLRAEQTKLCALVIIGVNERVRSIFWRLKMAFANRLRAGVRFC